MAAMPIYCKTFKHLLLQKRLADVVETWVQHLALEYYPISSNDDPMLIFDLFTQRSVLVSYAFVWENASMEDYSETIEVYDIKVVIYGELNNHMEIYMYQRSLSFFDLWPRSLRMKRDLR